MWSARGQWAIYHAATQPVLRRELGGQLLGVVSLPDAESRRPLSRANVEDHHLAGRGGRQETRQGRVSCAASRTSRPPLLTGSSSSLSRPPPRVELTLLAAASRSAAALRATDDAAAAACFFAPCRTRLFAKLGPFPLDEIHASSVRELARGGGGSGQSGGGRGGDAAAVAGVGRAALGGGGRPVAR